MKKVVVLTFVLFISLISVGCSNKEFVDYAADLKLNVDTSSTSYSVNGVGEATLTRCVDGDTAHFRDSKTNAEIKARFLGVDTPESTGKIEPWGKKASNFTCERLTNAKKITLSSVGDHPEKDSTGRDLAYVWADDRLINLELVQEGLSPYKMVEGSKFNDVFMKADFQAQKFLKYIWSSEDDDSYYYGDAIYVTIQELRENSAEYMGKKVTVEGTVTRKLNTDAFIEEMIEGQPYGIFLFTVYRDLEPIRLVGNKVKTTGVLTTFNDSLQLTDLKYNKLFPTPDDTILLSKGNTVVPKEITIDALNLTTNPYLAHTLILLKDVVCTGGKTEGTGESDPGSFTVYANVNGKQINLRFDKNALQNYKDENNQPITSHTYFVGKTLDVIGLVDVYYDSYQIKIITTNDLTIK